MRCRAIGVRGWASGQKVRAGGGNYRLVCSWELVQVAFQLPKNLLQRDFDGWVLSVLIGRQLGIRLQAKETATISGWCSHTL